MSLVRKRLIKSFGANTVGQGLNIVVQLFSIPLYLSAWGTHLYGEWLLLTTIPAYLIMSDMGLTSVAGNNMTMQVGSTDRSTALATFQSTWLFLSLISFLLIIIVLIISSLPMAIWLNLTLLGQENANMILLLLSIVVCFQLQEGLLNAGYRSDGYYALSVWISNGSRLVEFLIIALILVGGYGPTAIAAIMVLVRAVTFIVSRYILKRRLPWIFYGVKAARLSIIQSMALPSIAFMAFPLGNAIKNQGMLSIVGVALGATYVVDFSTMRTVLNSTQQLMGLINSAVWPEISRAYGAGNIELTKILHRISCKISLGFAIFSVFLLALYGDVIIRLWTNGQVELDPTFFNLMLLVMITTSLWFTSSVVLAATNYHQQMALVYLLSTVVSICIAWIMINMTGLSGIPIGLLITEVAMSIYVIKHSMKLVNDTFGSFARFMIYPHFVGFKPQYPIR